MFKRICALLLCLSVLMRPLPAFAAQSAYSSWGDFAGKTIGMLTGAAPFEKTVREKCPEAGECAFFNSMPDMLVALQAGKIDALLNNAAIASLAVSRYPDLAVFPEPLTETVMGAAFPKGSAWAPQFDAVTRRMMNDGTADALWDKWCSGNGAGQGLPEQDWPGANGTLRVAACATLEPCSYLSGDQVLGFDIESLLLAAKELDVHLEFLPVEFAEALALVQSGKADIACGSILISDERKESMDFAVTHANNLVLVTRSAGATATTQAAASLELSTPEDLIGKRIGVGMGSSAAKLIMTTYPDVHESELTYFNSVSEMVGALKSRKVDAFVLDKPMAELAAARNEGLAVQPENIVGDHYGFALPKGSPLTSQFNDALAKLRADGTIEAAYQKWTGSDESAKTMPVQDWDAPNGTLRAVADTESEPDCYYRENQIVGFSPEIVLDIAKELGYHVEFKSAPLASLLAELGSGKADVGLSLLSITEERKQAVDMTDPYYDGGLVAVVRVAEDAAGPSKGFFEGLADSFNRTFFVENRWQLILSGLGVTLLISVASGALGTALGFATMLARRRGNRLAEALVRGFEGLMGRLPIVVVLMVFYYVVFAAFDLPGALVAVLVFTLAFGASAGAIMWNSVRAVDVGQTEASLALGFDDRQTFFGVVLPQAARQFLPLLTGQFVSLVKDTAVVGYITVIDLTRAGDLIRSRTMEAFFPLISTAVIYFAICCLFAWALGAFNRRFEYESRPRTIKGVEL